MEYSHDNGINISGNRNGGSPASPSDIGKEFEIKVESLFGLIRANVTRGIVVADKKVDLLVIYTDIWVNPGFEDQSRFRYDVLRPYQLNEALVAKAPSDVLVMHNLPARRGEEITDGVMKMPNCIVFDQAENRLHVQKAILHWALQLGQ